MFRKLISDCLKREPNDRPNAKQLLKHEFFKKAKDKSFIVKHLALNSEVRNAKIKRNIQVPAVVKTSYNRRWKLGDDGEWIFGESDNDNEAGNDDDSDSDCDQPTIHNDKIKNNNEATTTTAPSSQSQILQNNDETVAASSTINPSNNKQQINNSNTINSQIETTPATPNSSSTPPSIHLVLRIRDEKKDLQDIKFDFLPNKDSVEEISNELVNAKLIDALDMAIGKQFNLKN